MTRHATESCEWLHPGKTCVESAYDAIDALQRRHTRIVEAIEQVHTPLKIDGEDTCLHDRHPWPCPTMRALYRIPDEIDPLLPTTSDGIKAMRPQGVFLHTLGGEKVRALDLFYNGIEDDKHQWIATFATYRPGDTVLVDVMPMRTTINVAAKVSDDPDRLPHG